MASRNRGGDQGQHGSESLTSPNGVPDQAGVESPNGVGHEHPRGVPLERTPHPDSDVDALRAKAREQHLLDEAFKGDTAGDAPYGLDDDPAKEAFPLLWIRMTHLKFPSGLLRETCAVRVTVGRSGCTATLSDLTWGYKLTVHTPHLPDVFQALETELQKEHPAWQPMTYGDGYNERKRKAKEEVDRRSGKR